MRETTHIISWVDWILKPPISIMGRLNTEGKAFFSLPNQIIRRFWMMLDTPMVVMREAMGTEFFFRRGSRAALSMRIPKRPVKTMLSRMAGSTPIWNPTKSSAAWAPKA